jgi:glycosyltransferase involved in cell wall biosynthesis
VQLAALVKRPDHACCRYRLAAFRPGLEQAGHALALHPLPRRWWARWRLLGELAGATVVLQRFLLPRWQLALLRRAARRLIFDFDDAVFLRDSFSPRGTNHPGRLLRFAAAVRSCDAVVAGNGFLADQAARWCGVHRVHVVPTCVDPERYPVRTNPGEGNDLVWIGSGSTLKGLQAVRPLLEALGRALPGLRLKVVCDRFPRFSHLGVIDAPWSEETEASELAASDIGISWLPDDPWSRGKCGLKVLQYMAAGLPVVANPVGVHREMVRHGETGYLASTPEQWIEAVGRLRRDPALRRRMGRAGRWLLESRYTVGAGASAWLDVLARLEDGPARAERGRQAA